MKNVFESFHENFTRTVLFAVLTILLSSGAAHATQTDIPSPGGNGRFGAAVTVLPNGNIVVTIPNYDAPGPVTDVGAVYLYDGTTLNIISMLTGSAANDLVGVGGITVLRNGNFVVHSHIWNGRRGAVTFGNAVTGVSGVVSSANSLVGSSADDEIGNKELDEGSGVVALSNGNYVVRSPYWDNPSPAAEDAGAVTWGNGAIGTSGVVSAANSLVGSTADDRVGFSDVAVLVNGNYVVRNPLWDNPSPARTNVGAATWGNGTTGISGAISNTNSLVGSTANDSVSGEGVVVLTNGNYVVRSPFWDNPSPVRANVGAVTWGSGTTGISGAISSANSLVGSSANDNVGFNIAFDGVTALTNGNYVVNSPNWDNPSPVRANVGAVTWGNGVTGISGVVSSANSLVGSTADDAVGSVGVTALSNGNYVASSSNWKNPAAVASFGAVTWGSGATGISGAVSSANSLIGPGRIGSRGVVALSNGNYVVRSPDWRNSSTGAEDAGAATWGNGATGTIGTVSDVNSLVGSSGEDLVGDEGVVALNNGNYVVRSPDWDNPSTGVVNVGAVTWGSGTGGTTGAISGTNSLVGSTRDDLVGDSFGGVTALTNGNYVVSNGYWDNPSPARVDVGAVTWGNGAGGTTGAVSGTNSLVGSTAGDQVGNFGSVALTNGNYVVRSPYWDNPATGVNGVGAVTWGNGAGGTTGAVSGTNSLVGSSADDNISGIRPIGSIRLNGVTALPNGNYVVYSESWDNPSPTVLTDAGATTFGNGATGTTGAITGGTTGGNSVVGAVAFETQVIAFDPARNRLFVGRPRSNTVSLLSFTTNAVANGNLTSAATWSGGVVPDGLINGVVPNGRTVTVSSKVSVGQLQIQCGGNLTGGSNSAYIVGSVRRDFCAAAGESFTFPLGDVNKYSPVTASNVTGTGNLTATVVDDFLPAFPFLPPTNSLSRYWTLNGTGITANLAFQYVDADVNGMETNYRLYKREAGLITPANPSTVNAAANTLSIPNVSEFSDWTGSVVAVAPTAASVTVGGRVLTPEGRGLMNATVFLTDVDGTVRQTRTTTFGYYRFDEIAAGTTYILSVQSKRYSFTPQIVAVTEGLTDLDFIAFPEP